MTASLRAVAVTVCAFVQVCYRFVQACLCPGVTEPTMTGNSLAMLISGALCQAGEGRPRWEPVTASLVLATEGSVC